MAGPNYMQIGVESKRRKKRELAWALHNPRHEPEISKSSPLEGKDRGPLHHGPARRRGSSDGPAKAGNLFEHRLTVKHPRREKKKMGRRRRGGKKSSRAKEEER